MASFTLIDLEGIAFSLKFFQPGHLFWSSGIWRPELNLSIVAKEVCSCVQENKTIDHHFVISHYRTTLVRSCK